MSPQNNTQPTTPATKKLSALNNGVSSPLLKFAIGAIAGSTVIIMPRLSSFLISGDENSTYFTNEYIIAIGVFSVILGLLVTIMEYNLTKPPKETFFAALAIPGLIAGSLNAVETDQTQNTQFEKAQELARKTQVERQYKINEIQLLDIIPIDLPSAQTPADTHSRTTDDKINHRIHFSLIRTAHASDANTGLIKQNNSRGFSVQREKASYTISIGHFNKLEDARTAAKTIRQSTPSVTLIRTHNGYELLSSNKIYTELEATLEAIEIENQLNIKPSLIKIK